MVVLINCASEQQFVCAITQDPQFSFQFIHRTLVIFETGEGGSPSSTKSRSRAACLGWSKFFLRLCETPPPGPKPFFSGWLGVPSSAFAAAHQQTSLPWAHPLKVTINEVSTGLANPNIQQNVIVVARPTQKRRALRELLERIRQPAGAGPCRRRGGDERWRLA